MGFREIYLNVITDPRYLENLEYGEPRSGHPEGSIKNHIVELEANLERIRSRLTDEEDYWKLKFLIHVHDTFKANAKKNIDLPTDPGSHAWLAMCFAREFTQDADILNMILYHDESYKLWKQFRAMGTYDQERFDAVLNTIKNWDLFLAFTLVDGHTPGKDLEKLDWFFLQVGKQRKISVAAWRGLL